MSTEPIVTVPDVLGLDALDACTLLRTANLSPSRPDLTGEPVSGVVTAQDPAGGSSVRTGTTVLVWTQGHSGISGAIPTDPRTGSKPLQPT